MLPETKYYFSLALSSEGFRTKICCAFDFDLKHLELSCMVWYWSKGRKVLCGQESWHVKISLATCRNKHKIIHRNLFRERFDIGVVLNGRSFGMVTCFLWISNMVCYFLKFQTHLSMCCCCCCCCFFFLKSCQTPLIRLPHDTGLNPSPGPSPNQEIYAKWNLYCKYLCSNCVCITKGLVGQMQVQCNNKNKI